MDRRNFLRFGTAATVGAATGTAATANASEPRIRRYVPLGRTGLEISDISFGSSSSADPALVTHALERGVNYFDSAESYRFGSAEEAIGKALRGSRDKVYVTSKTKASAHDTRKEMMNALEGSLRRLQTDYIDVYFNHAVNDVDRMKNPEWAEFTERAKEQGKIRFRGMSGHGGHLAESLEYAVDNDLVDVVLVAFNFGEDPKFTDRVRHTFHYVAIQSELPRVLEKAKAKNVGVVAMKTLMGARLNDMRRFERDGATFAQAAFRWVLANPLSDALVVSMTATDQIDEYLRASGSSSVGELDQHLLELYAHLQSGRYCRPGCSACEGSCPSEVAIAEVLRTRMYEVDYRDHELAQTDYAALGEGAGACLGCEHQACLGSCPVGIPIASYTRDTALRLACA